jgi:hypothetical protein
VTGSRPAEARPLEARLDTRISAPVDARLRLAHSILRVPIGHLIDEILHRHLPSTAELAEQVKETHND